MAQISRIQPKQGGASELLTIGGGIAGGILGAGNPAAIAGGAGLGNMAGGMVDPQKPPSTTIGGGDGSQASAMARRQMQASQDNLATLRQAEAVLPKLPEPLRQEYAPAIVQARLLEQNRRGMA